MLVLPVSVWADSSVALPVDLEAGRMEQDVALRDQHEPQQRLDDVGVEDVPRQRQERRRLHLDRVAHGHVEVGAEHAQVLAIRDPVAVAKQPDARPEHRRPTRRVRIRMSGGVVAAVRK